MVYYSRFTMFVFHVSCIRMACLLDYLIMKLSSKKIVFSVAFKLVLSDKPQVFPVVAAGRYEAYKLAVSQVLKQNLGHIEKLIRITESYRM